MIRVRVGPTEYDLNDVSEGWLNQQINGRRKDGIAVCVEVIFNTSGLNMRLSTPACGTGGGGRPPTPQERAIIDLWNKRHLNDENFSSGNVMSFLKQVTSYI